ncbi:tail fiber domain-containing protein [Limosilactobacillus fermentum]
MVQTLNFINLSSQQAPNDVDWAGLVKAGVQGALIRLGHGIIRDPCASGHIAKAKQYGLYWHGYHTYEGVVNEPQFTIKNATELGLSNSQYYFADLTKSSDPFNDYYALHATWLSQGYSTGLLISNDDYLSKFNDSEVIASGTLRWLISDTEPDGYDVWQYSSEGTVGISSVKVGFNFSKTDKLKYNLDTTLTGADINKDPYNPETPVGGAYIGWGYDTTGLGGGKTIGYSTDGKNFYALIGPDGLIVRKSDGNRIYGTISDQIDSAISANVIPAKSAADSAVSAANAAVESAQVTSDAVTAIASATAEAKQGANEAMSRAESAWDVATGAKEAVTDFDPLLKSAQSDAKQANETATSAYEQSRSAYDAVKADSSAVVAMQSSMADFQEDVASAQSVADSAKADAGKALTQIADTANALSDAKTAFNSGVAEAKQLASTAQTTADSAVESAGENAKALTSQANALSDVKKAMDSGVASATGLANTAQTTADNAVKSASSVANDLTAVSSQVKSNASGITKVTSDVGLLQTTVADNSGNISKIQETAAQIQQAVSDNAGNITVAKQTADSAVAVASDASSNATVAIQTASQASITASNASGQAASAVITAQGALTTASNAKSDATVAVQTASGASLTATNAQSDATIAKQTASEATVQASNAESDFAQLSIRANKIEANVATNSGAIASVQQTANGLTTSVSSISDRLKASGHKVKVQSSTFNTSGNYSDAGVWLDGTRVGSIGNGISFTMGTLNLDWSGYTQKDYATTSSLVSDLLALQDKIVVIYMADAIPPYGSDLVNALAKMGGDSKLATATSVSFIRSPFIFIGMSLDTNGNQVLQEGEGYLNAGIGGDGQVKYAWGYEGDSNKILTSSTIGKLTQIKTTVDGINTTINDPKTGLNATYQTAAGNATTISNVKSDVYQLQTTANGLTSRVGNLESKTDTQQTAIEQNKQAIALKANQTDVDKINGTVNQLQSSLTVQAGQIQTKVSASDVSGMLTGYATQEYTQSLVTQKADDWNVNLTKLKNDTQTSLTNLAIGVEGVQAQVYNSDGSSKITQLSSLIAAKVSQGDYNSQITQLKNDINLRVTKGDVISQINEEAGGNTLIQVSNGKKSLILDANNTIITGKAWIPDAAISSISADKIMLGSSSLYNSDGTLNLVNTKDGTTSKIIATQGNVDFDGTEKNASVIHFASDNNTNAFTITPVGATVTPTLFFERFDQTPGHWLGFTRNETEHEGVMFHTWDDDGERFFVDCHARFNKNLRTIGTLSQGSWDGTNGKPEAGVLTIKNGNTIWSGSDFLAVGSNVTNTYTGILAKAFVQQSTLSAKTNIETVNPKDALDLINQTDIRSYQYKSDVAQGKAKRYTSLIIDDVNDVSKYYAPDEFTNEERTGRDDGSAVGYLFLAVKELTRRIKNLEEKLNG